MADTLCNNIKVIRFVNSPVPSNAYLLVDGSGKNCIVIDPGSKDQSNIKNFLLSNNLSVDYIVLTHEHFDHCWGVNSLLESFSTKVVATRLCAEWVKTPMNYFNELYFDSSEMYSIHDIDIIAEEIGWQIPWRNTIIRLIDARGHTNKGLCVSVENALFTGDTMILNTKPFLKRKYGASLNDLSKTIEFIYSTFPSDTKVYAGHGEPFYLEDMREFYRVFFSNLEGVQLNCINSF